MTLTQVTKAGLDALALDHVFTIGASGTDHYTFQGEGINGTVNDPTLYLTRGKTYRFENGSGGHPIRIQSTSGASGTAYNTGVTNNAGSGTVIVEVQHDAPDVLYYQCTSHANMNGVLYITGALADGGVTTAKLADNAVTTAKIPTAAVTHIELANDSVITARIQDDAVTDAKLANSINSAIAANTAKNTNATHTGDVTGSGSLTIASNAVTTAKIADEAVTLAKLPHGDGSSDGKFLRANNGADPTFESLPSSGVTVSNNADNRVVTGDGTNLNAESSLVFDGTKLGVGTTSPQEILHVKAASETVSSRDGVILGTTDSLATDTGLPLLWASNIGVDADYPVASVCGRKENATSGEAGGYLQFATCNSPGAMAERMRIESSGKVMMGSSTQSASGNADNLVIYDGGAAGITIATGTTNQDCSIYFADSDDNDNGKLVYMTGNRQFRFYLDGSGSPVMQWNPDFSIYFNGNMYSGGGQYSTGSDLRMKSNLVRFTGTLDKLKQIVGYKFDITVPTTGATIPSAGVIAQDVEKVYPELVEEVEGYKHLQYNALIGVLVEAVKELTTRVETLETKVATLEAA